METINHSDLLSGSLSILVVDDEPSVALVCKRLLEKSGHKVFVLSDSEMVVEFFIENQAEIDVLICDMSMPGISGDIIITKVLEIKPDMATILMSGNTYRLPDSLQTFPSVALLEKPIEKKTLLETLKRSLKKA